MPARNTISAKNATDSGVHISLRFVSLTTASDEIHAEERRLPPAPRRRSVCRPRTAWVK